MIMKKSTTALIIALFLSLLLILTSVFIFYAREEQLYLNKVFVLSRHGVRTPLAQNLNEVTPKQWPEWKEKPGYLTQKGAILEGYMGKFFSEWLIDNQLLPKYCPQNEDIFIYTNVKQRTKHSAMSFVDNAFPGCNVTIHQSTNAVDPIFNAVIHNNSTLFRQIALQQMMEQLESLKLNNSYEEISDILNYTNSDMCLLNYKCNLTTDVNKIINVEFGLKPNILGPLKISNSVVDSFIMENYEGFKNVAWGMLDSKWSQIMNLSRGYHNVIFNTTLIAEDISKPLVKYLKNLFLDKHYKPKLTLLMGHDANIYTLLNSMDFKSYTLPNQHEITPVSGKIVFQKWFNSDTNKYLLKINYVYQSTKQLRDSVELSLNNPPKIVNLELKSCSVDENGYCSWDDFVRFLETL